MNGIQKGLFFIVLFSLTLPVFSQYDYLNDDYQKNGELFHWDKYCTASSKKIVYQLSSSKEKYRKGESVKITITIKNDSDLYLHSSRPYFLPHGHVMCVKYLQKTEKEDAWGNVPLTPKYLEKYEDLHERKQGKKQGLPFYSVQQFSVFPGKSTVFSGTSSPPLNDVFVMTKPGTYEVTVGMAVGLESVESGKEDVVFITSEKLLIEITK